MKTASNELHELIHTLSEKERNQFRKYCMFKTEETSSHYLKLFNEYTKQVEPDEQQIKQRLQLENFARVKNYLYQQVLSFIADNESTSTDKEIYNMLVVADDLLNRSMFKQGLTVLNKAAQIASDLDLHFILLIINEKKMQMQNYGSYIHQLNERIQYHEHGYKSIIEKIHNEHHYVSYGLKLKVYSLQQDVLKHTEESLKELKALVEPELEKGEGSPATFRAKNYFHISAGFYYQQINQPERALVHFLKCLDLFNEKEGYKIYYYRHYTTVLNNLLFCYAYNKQYNEIKKVLDTLKKIKTKNKFHQLTVLQTIALYETYYLKNVKIPDRKKRLKEIEKKIVPCLNLFQPHYSIQIIYHFSLNYFIDSDCKKAIEWLNKLDEYENKSVLKSLLCTIKIYKLIVYYELGKVDYLEYAIPNTYRYLLKQKQYNKLDKLILSALKKLIFSPTIKKQKEILSALYTELLSLKNDPLEKQVFEVFYFLEWVESKL